MNKHLIYEMLKGKRPFTGDQAPAIIHAVLYADLPDLKLPTQIPDSLTEVLKKSLMRDMVKRYPSLQELMDDLRSISNNRTIPSHEQTKINSNIKAPSFEEEATQFDPQKIEELIQELTSYVGPMASILVNKAVKKSNNYSELSEQLDKHLPDDKSRHSIRKRLDILSSTDRMASVTSSGLKNFSDEQLDCLISTSTSFIGPMSKLLVQKYSKQTDSNEELTAKLAEHIDNESEKNNFIKSSKNCF